MKKLTTIAAAVIFAVASVACGGSDRRTVVAEFADIGDLVTRANVQQSDAVVGTVQGIELLERQGSWVAEVTLRVDPETRVPQGTRAVVRSTSLLGEKYVDLIAPKGSTAPDMGSDARIPVSDSAKAPELEALFSQLGAILQTSALEDLAAITTASAMILEGQESNVGRVLDQTAKLIASLARQKDALASALDDLASASRTLDDRRSTLDRALDVSDDALGIVASQQTQLEDLVVALDKLGAPMARLTKAHKADINEQVEILNEVVPKVFEVRNTLADAVSKLPAFTKLFAEAIPGDHVQLDVYIEALPLGTPTSAPMTARSISAFLMEVTR
jgi:phospholipid/cholesterol/gamma-HCH transport system substrate-binding protein